jgi:hypothetical protein
MPLGEVVPGDAGPTGEVVLLGFSAGEVTGLVVLSVGVGLAGTAMSGVVVAGATVPG